MEPLFHLIQAYLTASPFPGTQGKYIAKIASERTLSIEDVCRIAVERGKALTTPEAMKYNVELFLQEMTSRLLNGFTINTGHFIARTQIQGVFDSPDEKFNSEKHTLLVQITQTEEIRKQLPYVQVQMNGSGRNEMQIQETIDIKTQSVSQLLTPLHVLRIKGKKLKIMGNNPAIGVYFKNEASGECTKVEMSDIAKNTPSELIVIIPDLQPGNYTLEVVNQYTRKGIIKKPRTAIFNKPLAVR